MNRLIKLLLALSLILSFVGCTPSKETVTTTTPTINAQIDEEFTKFLDDYVIEVVSQDYLSTHVYFENPSNYGIEFTSDEVNLGEVEYTQEDKQLIEDTKEKLLSFDRDLLSAINQDNYDQLLYDLDLQLAYMADDMAYLGSLFGPMSGFHSSIVTTLVDFVIRDENDLNNYIALINSLPDYLDKVIAYTDKQAANGTLMINFDSVLEYCQNIVDDDGTIYESLMAKVDSLDIDESSKENYRLQLDEAYHNSFIAMYEGIITYLNDLEKNSSNNELGLAHLPNGKAYYELLVKDKAGKDISVEELEELMQDLLVDNLTVMMTIIQNNPESYESFDLNMQTSFSSYDEILNFLENNVIKNFPSVGNLTYEVAGINPLIASSGTAAYFNIPAIDQTTPKQIRVNTLDSSLDISGLSTYITLAHEGLPGHMYQYAYNYQNRDSLFAKVNSNLAFTEGYAVYASYEALDYLSEIDPNHLALYKANEMIIYAILVLSDIGINYHGYDLEEFKEFITQAGLQLTEEGYQAQYEQLRDDPGAFIPYYAGYKQIMDLKEEAQETLGNKFDEVSFNQALLDSGNVPFIVVESHVENYISNNE